MYNGEEFYYCFTPTVTNEIPAECAPASPTSKTPIVTTTDIPATITTTNTTGSPPTSTSTPLGTGIPFTIAPAIWEVDKCKHLCKQR